RPAADVLRRLAAVLSTGILLSACTAAAAVWPGAELWAERAAYRHAHADRRCRLSADGDLRLSLAGRVDRLQLHCRAHRLRQPPQSLAESRSARGAARARRGLRGAAGDAGGD